MFSNFLFDLLSENPKRAIKITIFANLLVALLYFSGTFLYQQYKFNQVSRLLATDGYEYVDGFRVNNSLLPIHLLFKDTKTNNPTTFLYIHDMRKPIDVFSFYYSLGVNCKTKEFFSDPDYQVSSVEYFRNASQYDGQTAVDFLGHAWVRFIDVTTATLCS